MEKSDILYIICLLCGAILLVKLKEEKKWKAYRAGLLLATFGTLVSFGGLAMITIHNGMYPFETLSSHSIGAGEYLTAAVDNYDYAKERGMLSYVRTMIKLRIHSEDVRIF